MDMPDNLQSLGSSPEFDRATVPAALLSRHALAEHHWARLRVLAGTVTFVDLRAVRETTIAAGDTGVVPPTLPHRVELGSGARFQLEFFREREAG
jgi:tellurite resistance-related uncharacterized protein